MSVKRWNQWCAATHGHALGDDPSGAYVLASDYAALEAERDALKAELEQERSDAHREWQRMGAEAAKLRKVVEAARVLVDGCESDVTLPPAISDYDRLKAALREVES